MDLVCWIISFYSITICIDYTSNFHTCHHLLPMNDFQNMTYLIYLLGIKSWFVCHQPWLWHFLKWNRSIINSRNVDVMYQLWHKKAFKTLQMYVDITCYPDNFYASTCSRMPAKVYYELSRRFGTQNVSSLALARGSAGGCSILYFSW
jgi:hypothetical protein